MHDWNKALPPQQSRKLLVSNTFCRKPAEHCGRHQHDPDTRVHQALVNRPHHRHAKAKVFLAKPNPNTPRFQEVMKVFRCSLAIIPSVAQENVSKVRLRNGETFDLFSNWRQRPYLFGRIPHSGT